MAKNSTVTHDVAAEVVDYFIARSKKLERKAVERLGHPLTRDSQKRIVQGIDREIEAKFGFPMRKLYEV